mmetsp:Transcript_120583/g.352198  ORF Transcript_120583/g.352198 Transcript_120583/m.352198 type:complete len:204 (-) Transcript_120583:125-736(-)
MSFFSGLLRQGPGVQVLLAGATCNSLSTVELKLHMKPQLLKLFAGDPQRGDSRLCPDGGSPGFIAEQRLLSKVVPAFQDCNLLWLCVVRARLQDLGLTRTDHEELVAVFALLDDHLAGIEAPRRACARQDRVLIPRQPHEEWDINQEGHDGLVLIIHFLGQFPIIQLPPQTRSPGRAAHRRRQRSAGIAARGSLSTSLDRRAQ